MKFSGKDSEIYNSFCEEAKRDLNGAKTSIKHYFTSEKLEELEDYKEKIFAENSRIISGDEFLGNIWYSIFVPAILVVIIAFYDYIINQFNIEVGVEWKVNFPLIITGVFITLIGLYYTWTHRPNHKKQLDETQVKKLLYFLDNFEPK